MEFFGRRWLRSEIRIAAAAIIFASSPALAAPKLASHYAPMFEKGKVFTYDLALTDFEYIDSKNGRMKAVKRKPVLSTFTCTVTGVVSFPEAVVSTITCDKEIDSNYSFRADGMWVATRDGVQRTGGIDVPTTFKELDGLLGPPTIRANPKAFRTSKKDGFGGVFVQSVRLEQDAWCANEDTTKTGASDGGIITLCFKPGAGLVRGKNDYYGGTPRIVEYTLAKKR